MPDNSITSQILGVSTEQENQQQYQGDGWDNFKDNLYNAFEMGGDLGEFWFGDGEGAQSALKIASSLIYETAFGKDNIKAYNETDFSDWFGNIATSDSLEFQQMIKSFETEKQQTKKTMTFSEADSFTDYLSVASGAIVNVGGSVVYNLGTAGTGFFMEFAADNFIEANKVKAESQNITLNNLLESGKADASAAIKIAALQAGLEYVAFNRIMKPLKGTGIDKAYKKSVGKYLTNMYPKNKNVRIGLDIFSTGSTEALTEMGQTGLEVYNKELAIANAEGKDINPFMSVMNGMISPEGIEAGLQGFFGGSGLKGGGYSAKALNNIRKSKKELDVEQELSSLVSLTKRYNESKDETVKEALDKEIKSTEKLLKDKIKKGNDIYSSISNNDIKEIENLSDLVDVAAFRINELTQKFRNGEISEEDFNLAVKGLNEQYNKNKDGIIEILYQKNIEFAKTEAEKIGKKIVEIQTKEEFQQEYDKIRTEGDPEGDVTDTDGFIKGNNIYINTLTAKEEGAISVGSHELLHGIIGNHIDNLKDADRIKLGKQFMSTLNSEQQNVIRERLKGSYGIEGDAIYSNTGVNEMFTALSDAVVKGEVTFNETFGQQLKFALQDFIRSIMKAIPGVEVDYTKEFSDGRQAYNFLKEYNKNIKEGKLGKKALAFAEQTKEAEGVKFIKDSKSKAVDAVNEMEKGVKTKEEFQNPKVFNNVYNSIVKKNGAINNYVKSLGLSKEKFQETIDELGDRLMNYDPAAKRKTKSDEPITVGEFLMANVGYSKLEAAKALAIESKRKDKERPTDLGETTKEGDIKMQVEDTDTSAQEVLDEQDMSLEGIAKREAKENKAKKKRHSKFRQILGFETDGDTYNAVLDAARKSILLAYGKTQKITDSKARVDKIVDLIKKEYNSLNSDLFKPLKDFLGTKEYLNNLRKFREAIVESISTADLVQMEKFTPDSERIFTTFVKKLTKKSDVQDAVNKNLLPKDALNTIDKGEAVNLYQKVMPNPNEFIGFADQPAINPITKQRSGLKGTRKDGFAKRIGESLILDAVMEVRQEADVQQTLTEDLGAQMDIQQLASKIGREVDVKFSKSNAVTDMNNAIDLGTNTGVYSEIRFSKSHREQYENRLKKNRTDLTEEQRENAVQSVFDFVDGKDIPNHLKSKYEKMAMHYTANGYLILPEDGYKVIEAERLASIKKLDPFSFKNPNVLIEKYVDQVKATRTNPDKVKTFTNKTQLTNGVTVYDVEDSKQGQLDSRKVIDTHFGKKANPWCLLARDTRTDQRSGNFKTKAEAKQFADEYKAKGWEVETFYMEQQGEYEVYADLMGNKETELDGAFDMWKSYNKGGNGFKIAFQNGKLIAFRDGSSLKSWWDRMDQSSKGVVIKGKKTADGFTPTIELDGSKETITGYEKGKNDFRKSNGSYIRKDPNGNIIETHTKVNGKFVGERIAPGSEGAVTIDTFKDGKIVKRVQDSTKEMQLFKKGYDVRLGADKITVGNLTKWQSTTTGNNVSLMDGQDKKVEVIEGTVMQKESKDSQEGYDRYLGMQGEKVRIVRTRIGADTGNYNDISSATINGVEQETRVKFSSSKKIEVEHELTAREENILLPSYLNKEINRLKNTQDISTEESELLEILEEMRNLSGSGAVNIYNIMLNAFPYAFKNMVVADFSSEQSFVDAIKRNTQAQMKINAYSTSKRILEKQTIDLKPEQAVPKIVDYLINLGRDVRSALIIPTNKGLKIDLINGLQDGKFKDYFRAEPISKGSSKYKMQYKNSKGEFVDVEIYDSVKKIKENINKPGERARFNEQAERAQEYRLNLLDPKNKDHTLGDKLDNIELANTGTKGGGRKTAKVDVTITTDVDVLNKYSKIVAKLILEHEVTIKNMKAYERAYAKGNISREQMKSVYEQNKVHILPEGIDTVLQEAGKVSQRLGMGYESIPTAEKYLIDLLEKGIIDKLPDSLDTLFVRKSENFKDMVLFSKSTNKPTKGITILDFDDTLATSSSLIRFTRPDGTRGTLTPEQYASTYQDLLGLDYKFDFSEFNKVVDGKPAPLLNKAKKLAGKFGTKNMFILTARPKESAVAIQKFLKENGLNIPLKNITGLGNSTADAKALWVLDKANEGYNDFYFADDAIQNVQAVQNMLDQIDVKSKVQQAIPDFTHQKVKFSKSSFKNTINSPQLKKFRNNIKDKILYHGGSKSINTIRDNNAVWFYLDDAEGAQLHGREVYSVKASDIQDMVVIPDPNDNDVMPQFVDHSKNKFGFLKTQPVAGESSIQNVVTGEVSNFWLLHNILKHPKADVLIAEWVSYSSKNSEEVYDKQGNAWRGQPVVVLGVIPKNKIQDITPKFSKSSLRGNKAVNNLLSQIDVKSKVQRDRVKFSKSINEDFNNILEDVSGIDSIKRFSEAKGKRRGKSKGKFRYFVPPSHEDFIGLLYNFMGKGKKGNEHRSFFEQALVRPLNRAYRELNAAKQTIANEYRALIKGMPIVSKKLGKKILDGDFTNEDAIRVYLWDKFGFKIPGLSETDQKQLSDFVKDDPMLQSFADMIGTISKDKEGYVKPSDNWDMGGIKYDLIDATGRIGRAQFFQEFIENADIIFSKENLNKIEAIYGADFRSAVEDMLYRVKNGTNRPTGTNKMVNGWMDWINGSIGATMFFNARSALLQQLSFVNFMNFSDNNMFKAAARFANQKQFWSDFAMIFNSNYLKQRRSGAGFDVNASEIAREVSGAVNPARAAIRYLLNLGFLPTQMGDSFAIAIGGASFYRNRVATYLKEGLSQKEAEGKAFIDFQQIAEATQQSARPDMISQQQASVLGRFVLAFQNVTSQYARIVKKSTADIVKRRVSPGYKTQGKSDMANVSRIMYYGAAQSVIFYGLQTALFAMMFDDDEKDEEFFDKKKDRIINGTIDSLLRGAGVLGAVISTVKNYVIKVVENSKSDSWFNSPAWPELLSISPPISIKQRKISGGERTADWNKDVIKEMEVMDIDNPLWDSVTSTVEGFTNIPLNRLYKKVQNLRAAQDSENAWWQRVAVALGWSKWDVGIENKKVDEVKKKIKKDKSNKKKTKEDKKEESINIKKQKQEKKEGKKDIKCAATSKSGNRCKTTIEPGQSYCTIHEKVTQNKSGKKSQCKKIKKDKKRCGMQTNSKSGYCYYHD